MDSAAHREATGVSNERILKIAEGLMRTGKPVRFRIPVILTVNDMLEAIGELSAYVRRLSDLRIATNAETGADMPPPVLGLLRFHRLAAGKYRSLGLEYRASDLAAPSLEHMDSLRDVARSYGIEIEF